MDRRGGRLLLALGNRHGRLSLVILAGGKTSPLSSFESPPPLLALLPTTPIGLGAPLLAPLPEFCSVDDEGRAALAAAAALSAATGKGTKVSGGE